MYVCMCIGDHRQCGSDTEDIGAQPDLTYVWFDFHPECERAGEWKSPGDGCRTECVCSYLIVSLITVCVLFVCMYDYYVSGSLVRVQLYS